MRREKRRHQSLPSPLSSLSLCHSAVISGGPPAHTAFTLFHITSLVHDSDVHTHTRGQTRTLSHHRRHVRCNFKTLANASMMEECAGTTTPGHFPHCTSCGVMCPCDTMFWLYKRPPSAHVCCLPHSSDALPLLRQLCLLQ